MNQETEEGTKTLQEEFREIVATVPKENTQKSATKALHSKYAPHAGLKFDFNRKTKIVVKPFSFDSRTKNEKGSTTLTAINTPAKQTNEEENIKLGDQVKTSMENLKFSMVLEKANNKSTASASASDGSTLLSEDNANLCDDVIKSLDVINPVPQTSKVIRSKLPTLLKPKTEASGTSKLLSSTVVEPEKLSKDSKLQQIPKQDMVQPMKFAKPQIPTIQKDAKMSHKKYHAYSGLKLDIHSDGKKKSTIVEPFNFEKRSIGLTKKSTSSEKRTLKKEMSTTHENQERK